MRSLGLLAELRRANRLALLFGLAGIAVGTLGIRLAADVGWIRFFDNLHWTSATTAAAVLAWLGWRQSRDAHSRRALKWFFVGLVVYAFGQIVWDIQVALSYTAFPAPSDLFYLCLGPCLTIGLFFETRGRIRADHHEAFLLDVLALAVAALTLVLVSYLPRRGNLDFLSMAVMISYPVSLLVPACMALAMIPALRLRITPGIVLFLAGVAGTAWSWMNWNSMALDRATLDGTWFNVFFSIAVLIDGLAVSAWRVEISDSADWDRRCEAFLRMLPIITILFAGLAIIVVGSTPELSGMVEQLTYAGSVIVIILAIIRQSRLLHERDQLVATQSEALRTGALLRSIINTAPVRVFWKDRGLRYLGCNELFARDAGFERPEQLLGKTDYDMGWRDQAERYRADDLAVMESGTAKLDFEEPSTTPDGRTIWLSTSKVPLRTADGQVYGVLGTYSDITQRKSVEEDLRVAAATFQSREAMLITDADANIIRVNRAFEEITGYQAEEVIGRNPRILQSGRHDAAFYAAMWSSLHETGMWSGELWDRRKNGEIYPKYMTITAVYDDAQRLSNYVAAFNDISQRKQTEEAIHQLAFFDGLTKLPNRRLFLDRLQHCMAASQRSGRHGALLMLDLDNFKTINDTLGHATGDLLLSEVARRLKAVVREGDTVARLGGDEFVVVLEELGIRPEEAATQAEQTAEKIRTELAQPFQLQDRVHHSTSSIGVSLFRGHVENESDLLRQADLAMYQAKAAGRDAVRFYDPQMQAALDRHAALEEDLRHAMSKQEFQLHYQVQVDNQARPLGAEVLLRWQHPERGFVYPDQFIPVAEDTGLIVPIGLWVLEAACTQLALWQDDPLTRELTLAVNVSARQFRQMDFVAQVQRILRDCASNPERLKLELTESVVLENIEDAIEKMQSLKALGVEFSIDDFGTGHSSLSYLKRLPLAQIKIDRSFVRDIATDPNDAAIVNTIIAMSRTLGLNVIAEGVETEAQREFLDEHGCHAFQGYLFGRPLGLDEFKSALKRSFREKDTVPPVRGNCLEG